MPGWQGLVYYSALSIRSVRWQYSLSSSAPFQATLFFDSNLSLLLFKLPGYLIDSLHPPGIYF